VSLQSTNSNLYLYFLSDDRIARIGRNTAIEFRDRTLTYEELRAQADHWAAELRNHKVVAGDRVLLILYDSPEFIACFLACAAIGAIAVPVNTFLSPDDVELIARDSDARLIIAESELSDKITPEAARGRIRINIDSDNRPCLFEDRQTSLSPAIAGTDETSPAFILYTSGSTGRPKGVLHRHGAIPATIDTYSRSVLKLTDTDRIYSASRMFFAYGLGNSLSFPLAAGATTILHTERATPDFVAGVIQQRKPTVFFGVPALYGALLKRYADGAGLDLGGLRLCCSAGEALPGRIFEDWKRETGLSILDGIGSTEMLHIFISNTPDDARPDCSGTVVNGYQARLLDDEAREVDAGQVGNLWVRGPSATSGYWNMPDLTAAIMRDGWVKTGDLYRRDDDGYYYQLGRSDDCFKVKGLWVSPLEVESVLLSHETVIEAAVVPDFDSSGLATAHAFVVIREERTGEGAAEALLSYAAARLPGHKVPSRIDLVEALPRTATGKVQRFKLKQRRF
jgi:benzoate-CoA ligase family protein